LQLTSERLAGNPVSAEQSNEKRCNAPQERMLEMPEVSKITLIFNYDFSRIIGNFNERIFALVESPANESTLGLVEVIARIGENHLKYNRLTFLPSEVCGIIHILHTTNIKQMSHHHYWQRLIFIRGAGVTARPLCGTGVRVRKIFYLIFHRL